MTKEYKYGNLSEEHELIYHLTKNNKRSTQDNIETLRVNLNVEKIVLDKHTLTHDEIDNVIREFDDILEDK